ncbi:MAG: nucleotidyltransferase domain-containing protein [Candidatus Omnitrophica bacterium]|nr:nucleotidyltransferase domain-containing protein [Candidatus Omnitrophota bacterium]
MIPQNAKTLLTKVRSIRYAFLFGSSLKRPLPGSDIDILIGGSLTPRERTHLSIELEGIFKRKVDIVAAGKAPSELVLKAFATGVPLFIRNKRMLNQDYFRNFYECEDNVALRALRLARVKRGYRHGR